MKQSPWGVLCDVLTRVRIPESLRVTTACLRACAPQLSWKHEHQSYQSRACSVGIWIALGDRHAFPKASRQKL